MDRTLLERQQRLQDFLTKSPVAKDLEELVFKLIRFNAEVGLKRTNPENREQFVGKVAVLEEIDMAFREIKGMEFKKDEK